MKNYLVILVLISFFMLDACKEKHITEPEPSTDNYTSMADFFAKNASPMQTYTVDAVAGGSFTTPQGTNVTVGANSFVYQNGNPITSGSVTIEFKDIYKKSDMLLNNMPTEYYTGQAMASGGEFFFRAKQGSANVQLNGNTPAVVKMPLNGKPVDTAMKAMTNRNDTAYSGTILWYPTISDTIYFTTANYLYSLVELTSPLDSGTWTNCDHCFASYSPTTLTIHGSDNYPTFYTRVYLVFKDFNTTVTLQYWGSDFVYPFAPIGYSCTMVAVGIKDGKPYSSFTPITISANQTVNFTLSETTTDKFKAALKALD